MDKLRKRGKHEDKPKTHENKLNKAEISRDERWKIETHTEEEICKDKLIETHTLRDTLREIEKILPPRKIMKTNFVALDNSYIFGQQKYDVLVNIKDLLR